MSTLASSAAERAAYIRNQMPAIGLFAGHTWRVSPQPFVLDAALVQQLEFLGRIILAFYKAANLLYRQSAQGQQPSWVAELADQGKPAGLIETQRSSIFKNELPRVLRPDILLTEDGFKITELDSVPGGIGLTGWLNEVYSALPAEGYGPIIGGATGMVDGFAGIFAPGPVHIVVSEESKTYRPEMEWLAQKAGERFKVRDSHFREFQPGDSVYRFFELFDLVNISNAEKILHLARQKQVQLTPPPKPVLEEKFWLALLWNRNLREFWRTQLGDGFLQRLLQHVPMSWVVDPAPLPPHAAYPELNLTQWQQLKSLSQKERDLILKISGFSEKAWGARGVYLGSDLSQADWSHAVDEALRNFSESPSLLQRFAKPKTVGFSWFDFETGKLVPMPSRVRLCPYYFVHGTGDAARTHLGGILATACPADKKIIHGMSEAVLVPCASVVSLNKFLSQAS